MASLNSQDQPEKPAGSLPIRQLACARIPTAEGEFQLCLYASPDGKEHLALVLGDVVTTAVGDVLVRIHSECFTGDVLGSRRCDCGPQLHEAMRLIEEAGRGVIVYLRQEGRGIGLAEKLRAYNLQDEGYDTVEANLALGHQADAREYSAAAAILRDLGVTRMKLMTNNPAKIESLQSHKLTVTARVPLITGITAENAAYLATKAERMRHLFDIDLLKQPPVVSLAERPRVTLTYAQSIDGAIAARRGEPLRLSGDESMRMTHQLRADHDAILVGIGTLLSDDPRLTVRLVEGADPRPVILDSRLRTPLAARIVATGRAPLLATTAAAPAARRKALAAAGAEILILPANPVGQVDLAALLAALFERGVRRLMVEGGAAVIGSFLAARFVDRLVVTLAPQLIGGLPALPPTFSGVPPRLMGVRYEMLGRDLVLAADVAWPDEVGG